MNWSDSLATVVRLAAIPYGYTIVVWSAGAISVSSYGWPKPVHVVLFVAGAVAGYLALALIVAVSDDTSLGPEGRLKGSALLNMVPVIPPIVTALAVKKLHHTTFGYFAVSFSCTITYMAGLVLLVRFAGT